APMPRTGSRNEARTSSRMSQTLRPVTSARPPAIPPRMRSGPRRKPILRMESNNAFMTATLRTRRVTVSSADRRRRLGQTGRSRPGEVRGVFGGDADAEDPRRNAGERGERRQQPFHGPGRPDGPQSVNGRFDHSVDHGLEELDGASGRQPPDPNAPQVGRPEVPGAQRWGEHPGGRDSVLDREVDPDSAQGTH